MPNLVKRIDLETKHFEYLGAINCKTIENLDFAYWVYFKEMLYTKALKKNLIAILSLNRTS